MAKKKITKKAEEIIKDETTNKKTEETTKEEAEKTEKKESSRKELYWILSIMTFLILVLFVSYYIINSKNVFKYEGLTFTKEKSGELDLFHYYYFFTLDSQQYKFNLYLRNDPRKNKVPITGEIEYFRGSPIYLSINRTGLS